MATAYRIIDTMLDTDIIRAEDYDVIVKAINLIKCANKEAESIIENANNIYEERKAKGYDDGINQFDQECIVRSIDITSAIVNSLEHFEKEIASTVVYCVKKILVDYHPNEALAAMIKNAIKSINMEKNIILKMSEEQIQEIKDEIMVISKKFPNIVIKLVADNSVPMGDCIVFSDFCTVKTGIQNYLEAFADQINEKFTVHEE